MSLETWIAEFMPTPAASAGGTEAEAIAHCLQKWKGYRKESLEKHGSVAAHPEATNCALCLRHACDTCSLALSRGGVGCDDCTKDEEVSPYHAYVHPYGKKPRDPEPMIAALEDAAIFAKENEL